LRRQRHADLFVDGQSKQSGSGGKSFAQTAFTGCGPHRSGWRPRRRCRSMAQARITGNAIRCRRGKLLPGGRSRRQVSLHVALAGNDAVVIERHAVS
jgi:hypothetical protein